MISQQNKPFIVLFALVSTLLLLPSWLNHGMFMDGTQYAIVSRNLAEGKGSFWYPYLCSTWAKQDVLYFMEHPPLFFYLESLFFKWFGDSYLTERFFCFFTFLLNVFFIHRIWKFLAEKFTQLTLTSWLPLLLWIIIPSAYWSFSNNMIENLVSVFLVISIYLLLLAYFKSGKSAIFIYSALSGIFIFLGTFTKGLPAFFPIIGLIAFQVTFKKHHWKQVILGTFIMIAFSIGIYAALFLVNDDARISLSFYLKERVFYRIQNEPQVGNRFELLLWLFSDALVPLGITGLIFLIVKLKKITTHSSSEVKQAALAFLLIGLAGSLPFIFTKVQRAVYYVPALPFLAISLALYTHKHWKTTIDIFYKYQKAFQTFFAILSYAFLFSVSIIAYYQGGVIRDKEVLSEVDKIAKETGPNKKIEVPYQIYYEWGFQFYLLRYHNITLNPWGGKTDYKLTFREEGPVDVYFLKHHDIHSKKYYLYEYLH